MTGWSHLSSLPELGVAYLTSEETPILWLSPDAPKAGRQKGYEACLHKGEISMLGQKCDVLSQRYICDVFALFKALMWGILTGLWRACQYEIEQGS